MQHFWQGRVVNETPPRENLVGKVDALDLIAGQRSLR
jgi:hypothetical protein